jgi:hypothetical protein
MTSVKTAIVATMAMVGVGGQVGEPTSQRGEAPAEFLERLEGRWSVVTEATLGPGQTPVRTESRVAARLLAGKWLVAEGRGTAPGGQTVISILTLGHDPAEERFVGTWISSMQTHLWRYTGMLNPSGTALTLETRGPILGDPATTANYREIIEIESADHHVIRSMILGPDGKWFEFARAEYRRL